MAKFGQTNVMIGGGGSSEECTAKLSDIPKGLKAITSDSKDEPGVGTMSLSGNATTNKVLAGNTFYSTDYKTKQTGTMKDCTIVDPEIGGINASYPNVAIRRAKNPQFSSTIVSKERLFCMRPELSGYYSNGVYIGIAAAELGNADAGRVLQGVSFTSQNGMKMAGTMTVNSILSFKVAGVSGRQVLFQWQNPTSAYGKPFSAILINYSTSGYPGSGGTRLYTGYGNNSASGGISQVWLNLPALGTTYYISAYAYAKCSAGDIWGQEFRATATTGGTMTKTYTSSQNVTVPAGYTKADIFCVGGGGGGSRGSSSGGGGGGGAGGYTTSAFNIAVSQGEVLNIYVGAGGAGDGKSGGKSYVMRSGSTLCQANGGTNSQGGSDGGGSGENGYSNGAGHNFTSGGKPLYSGQGTTTTAFGENSGTLYAAGGGGGAAYYTFGPYYGGAGGNYGGGNGGNGGYRSGGSSSEGYDYAWPTAGASATAGTGSGGGGGGGGNERTGGAGGGNGGSGVVLIRFK